MHVWIPGRPQQAGSKTRSRHGGVYDDNKNLAPWKKRTRELVAETLGPDYPPTEHAVAVRVRFIFTRPKSHYTAKGALRSSSPRLPATRPDIDKLERAILDALTGLVYRDDGQVTMLTATKEYGNVDGIDLHADVIA